MIYCAASGNAYVGSSASVYYRLHAHRSRLNAGTHTTVHLQHAYSLYGEEQFRFLLLDRWDNSRELTQQALVDRENHYLVDTVERAKLYNTVIPATIGRGLGFKNSDASRAKMRATWQKKVEGGYVLPEGMGAVGEEHHKAKLTEKSINEIKDLRKSGATRESLAAQFGVSISTVDKILGGRSWKHLPSSQDTVLIGKTMTTPKGEDHPHATLSNADVTRIKALVEAGKMSQGKIGRMFGVSQAHVSRIKLKLSRVV